MAWCSSLKWTDPSSNSYLCMMRNAMLGDGVFLPPLTPYSESFRLWVWVYKSNFTLTVSAWTIFSYTVIFGSISKWAQLKSSRNLTKDEHAEKYRPESHQFEGYLQSRLPTVYSRAFIQADTTYSYQNNLSSQKYQMNKLFVYLLEISNDVPGKSTNDPQNTFRKILVTPT